nr:hypothetical protein [uncultured Tyzzerella sp.]
MRVNRIVSFLLCVVMLIGSMPLSIMATPQKHVKIKSIKAINNVKDPAYEFRLEWTNPDWGTDLQHQPKEIKIMERIAKNMPFQSIGTVDKDKNSYDVKKSNATSGSIYEYKILPYHMHSDPGKPEVEAPYDPTTPEETALFMTDIKVDATGYGNTLEVTFDNPTYDGKNIFTGYRIYYEAGGETVKTFNSKVDVKIDNKDLVVSNDDVRQVKRFTYKITNENIKPSNIYAVKVEPLYNTQEIRSKDTNQIFIDDKTKHISFNSSQRVEYRTNNAYVSIPLFVFEDGKDYLKLQWGDISGLTTSGPIKKIEILSGTSEDKIENVIGTIHGESDIQNINTARITKPTETTYFKIKVYVGGTKPDLSDATTVESMIAMYDPAIVNVTPNKPNIYPKNNVSGNKPVIDLYWDTFMRPPYNKDEEALAENGLIFDTKVVYDVWITDSLANLNRLGLPKIMDKVPATDIQTTNIKDVKHKVFYNQIKEYVTVDGTGAFITKPIDENKVYYIKIVATKPTSDGLGLEALPAISQIYVPPAGDISKPKSLSKPPFRVKKDENGNDIITQTDITVQWNTKWFEVYDTTTGTWHSIASIRDGKLIFGKEVKDTDKIILFYDKDTPEEVKKAFKDAGYAQADSLIVRSMDISAKDIKYEMIVLPFSEIEQSGGYEKYIEQLLQSEGEQWKEINPVFTEPKYAEHLISGLTENTMYAILLRPYRILTDGKKDAYPTYLLATTLPKDTEVDVTPTIPRLYEVGKTDMSIEVEWEKAANKIVYELAVDENVLEDPSKAKMIIDSKNIQDNAIAYNKEDGRQFLKYNIKPLFPDTGYYIWIRAIVEGTDKSSDWSTPLYIRTNNIKNPEPPSGFGLASEKSLSTYNTNNNTDYKPITDKYLVLEWLRDPEDLATEPKAETKGTAEPLIDAKIKKTYMVKFNELIANRYYYTRAKTKLYVTKSKDGKIERYYSYIIELADNPNFKDSVQIEIPTIDAKGDRVLTAESEWTTVYKYRTKFSTDGDGDYDGNIIDDLYPLPTEDFEILYDGATQTLTYRFRSNQKDSNGNGDNLVDQRFITKLINNKVYNYNLDLTKHKNYNIKNRKVEIPYSIIAALNERKIALTITTGGTRFTLNPGFLNTPEVKKVGKLGMNTTAVIEITQNPENLPILNYNQTYATTPEYIKMSINNNGVYTPLTFTGSNMDIMLKLKNRSLTLDKNVGAYRNVDNNIWERVPSSYSSETGIHTVKTNRLGKYTTISNGINESNVNFANDNNLLTNVNNKIIFKDLTNVNMKDSISVVQFNNIVAGIANNKKEIYINGGLSSEDYQSLQRSGMLLQGSVVGREAGINSLVKLYEMKTKSKYEPTSNINTTPYKDIKNANKAYQANLIKAGDIGFYGNDVAANPKATMTIEQMLYMIDIILEDSGY